MQNHSMQQRKKLRPQLKPQKKKQDQNPKQPQLEKPKNKQEIKANVENEKITFESREAKNIYNEAEATTAAENYKDFYKNPRVYLRKNLKKLQFAQLKEIKKSEKYWMK